MKTFWLQLPFVCISYKPLVKFELSSLSDTSSNLPGGLFFVVDFFSEQSNKNYDQNQPKWVEI